MPADDRARAVDAATSFVQMQMGANDLATVIDMRNGAPVVLQDFTADRDGLVRAIGTLTGEAAETIDSQRQLASLETAMRMLGTLSDKKALIYLSSSHPRGDAPDAALQAVVNAAIRANVAIYPIDTRGLVPNNLPGTYRLAAGDQVSVTVWESHLIDGSYTVRADGILAIPQLGDIKAAGLTPAALQAVIEDRLGTSGITKDAHATVNVVWVHGQK